MTACGAPNGFPVPAVPVAGARRQQTPEVAQLLRVAWVIIEVVTRRREQGITACSSEVACTRSSECTEALLEVH